LQKVVQLIRSEILEGVALEHGRVSCEEVSLLGALVRVGWGRARQRGQVPLGRGSHACSREIIVVVKKELLIAEDHAEELPIFTSLLWLLLTVLGS
jgi:hypothetical protein